MFPNRTDDRLFSVMAG